MEKTEFRVLIKHCFLMGKNTVQAKQWIEECYTDSCPSKATICRWFAEFKRGRTDTNDAERSGRPVEAVTPENIIQVFERSGMLMNQILIFQILKMIRKINDVKEPSFAPLDLQYDSSSEEETKEEVSIVPEISLVDSVLEQKSSYPSIVSLNLKDLKGKEYVYH
ncbi:HTH_48 domain-containing protein [Nephila pilipes]|uniref:HTH_48 domain-containing protein n=1 Tax=Nephila pilipes TaxID=299642 RepID=A0A8X6MV22_NEPPI|nr:HTH_48 domain-containing protein [Nephila pilipes]